MSDEKELDARFRELFDRAFDHQAPSNAGSASRGLNAAISYSTHRAFFSRAARRGHRRHTRLLYAILLIILSVGLSGGFLVGHDRIGAPSNSSLKAALVDELSATMPDPSFVSSAVDALTRAGYTVDYYGPNRATVDLYRNLPSMGYGLVIFRAHTAWSRSTGIAILTSEPYTTNKYALEQLTDQLDRVTVYQSQDFFAITPVFVREAMQGKFPGSNILVMGCDGLVDTTMAKAFLDRGAGAYASWNGLVTLHTDVTTGALVGSVAQGTSFRGAVSSAMAETGADPVTHSQLVYVDSGTLEYGQLTGTLLEVGSALALVGLALVGPFLVLMLPRLSGIRFRRKA